MWSQCQDHKGKIMQPHARALQYTEYLPTNPDHLYIQLVCNTKPQDSLHWDKHCH